MCKSQIKLLWCSPTGVDTFSTNFIFTLILGVQVSQFPILTLKFSTLFNQDKDVEVFMWKYYWNFGSKVIS